MAVYGDCMLSTTCKVAGNLDHCNQLCYGWRYFHGADGTKGIWGAADIPKLYGRSRVDELPFQRENPKAYAIIKRYSFDTMKFTGENTKCTMSQTTLFIAIKEAYGNKP